MSRLSDKRRKKFESLAHKIETETMEDIKTASTSAVVKAGDPHLILPKALAHVDKFTFERERFAIEYVSNGQNSEEAYKTIHPFKSNGLHILTIRKLAARILGHEFTKYCIDRERYSVMKEGRLTVANIVARMDDNTKKAENTGQLKTAQAGLKELLVHVKPVEKEVGKTVINNLIVIPQQVALDTPVRPIELDEVPEGFSRKNIIDVESEDVK
jgi:hypothetical protein